MTEPADTGHERGAADRSVELGRMAAEMLQNSPLISMNPLIAQPAAAMAAATAIGFSVTTQMAGAFFGALQGALDVTNRIARPSEARTEAMAAEQVVASVSPAHQPIVVRTRTRTQKAEPVAAKPVVAKKALAPKAAKPPVAGRKPASKTDDLKRIAGIGPKLEQVLAQRGVKAIADIAGWSEADVTRFDAELGLDGRIGRDDWVGQAKQLAPKPRRRK
jgi:NADH-quinone oxidoreductase subunit E